MVEETAPDPSEELAQSLLSLMNFLKRRALVIPQSAVYCPRSNLTKYLTIHHVIPKTYKFVSIF